MGEEPRKPITVWGIEGPHGKDDDEFEFEGYGPVFGHRPDAVARAAELNGITPERQAELERLFSDKPALELTKSEVDALIEQRYSVVDLDFYPASS